MLSNSSPERDGSVHQNSRAGKQSPQASANSVMRNASNCNSSKTCNAPMCTNSTKRGATQPSCKCSQAPTPSNRLAEKIGRSEKYVYARLRLTHLVDEIQRAFYVGKLTVAHAFEIARLQPDDQRRALTECFPEHRTTAAVLKDKKAEAVTVRSLREWIEREIHLDISNAPFDPQDGNLLPSAGSCAACPKLTGNNPLLFPEVRQKSICTDRACYRAKVEALVQIRVKPLEESGVKPLRVSSAPAWQTKKPQPDVLYEGQYRRITEKNECQHTKPAVIVDGPKAGTVLHVCRDEKCSVHAGGTRYQTSPQERAARAKELLSERIEKQSRVRILDAIRKKLPGTLSRPDLEMAATRLFP